MVYIWPQGTGLGFRVGLGTYFSMLVPLGPHHTALEYVEHLGRKGVHIFGKIDPALSSAHCSLSW